MARIVKWVGFAVAAFFATAALAQYPEPRGRVTFAQPELDQMLAPIALYPDSLLSQIFMAATYPRELAEAASWSRANYGLRGEQAVRAVEREDWDPSVVSLVAFPQVLAMLDERRDWTERLGDAFLDQPDQVMETVQGLRRRADASGSLRSSEEIVVQRQGYDYVIDSPSPEVVYVPYYDPRVAYGAWWWPDYQPVYWNPWPGYGYRAGYRGFGWDYGISIGSGFFYGSFDWPRRYLRYASHRPWYHYGHDYRGGHRWAHGRDYRHGHRGGEGRSTQWRAGDRDRDARWRDRDGRPDRRDGRAPERRDARTSERRAATIQAPATAQGFFPPRAESPAPQRAAPQNPALRTASPRYRSDGPRPEGRIAPQSLQPQVQPQAQAPVPQTRSAPSRPWPAAPTQVEQRRAPPTPSPVERAAVARPQMERQAAQAAPAERSAPAERASQSPVERSGGSRSGGRER